MLLAERVSRTRAQATSLVRKNTAIVVAAILAAMLFQYLLLALSMPPEAALSFQCGLLIADGKIPFVDFFDVSSPALMYLNAIPAVVSKLIPIAHPIVIFHIFLSALTGASCYLSASILFRQRMREQSHAPMFIIGFALLNLLMINEAGQRENLFLLFYVPFFLCRWLTWTNQRCEKRLAMAAGISGGVALCLDPLCLLAGLAMEVFFLVSKLKIKPFRSTETAAAGVVFTLFICHFAFFPSVYANSYFNWALPLVLCDFRMWDDRLFWANKTPDLRKLIYALIFMVVVALGLRRWSSLIPPSIALFVVGLGMFIIQGKSMTYQALPMIFGAGLSFFLVLSVFVNGLMRWKKTNGEMFKTKVVSVVAVLLLAGFVAFKLHQVKGFEKFDLSRLGYSGTTYLADPSVAATELMRDTEIGDGVLILNDRVRPAYPLLVQYRRKPAGYLLTGYPLRMSRILIDSDPANSGSYAGTQFQMYQRLLADIQAKPKLIMVERESLGGVLTDHEVMKTIEQLYEESCYAEWPDSDAEQVFDYYAFRTAPTVYKLRVTPLPAPPSAPPPVAPPPVAPTPVPAPAPAPAPAPVVPVTPAPAAPTEPVEPETDPVTGLPIAPTPVPPK